jgi:hypothetical protein
VFRRREKQDVEARREEERRVLFARLAERPDHVCPFLGLAEDRTGYHPGASDDHRCYAFGDPASLSDSQQTRVCLQRGYGNCPRYLRGVLVIPTEELEALRRPARPPAAAAPPPGAEPADRRRRVPVLLLVLLLLLVGAGGAVGWVVFGPGRAGIAIVSPSPRGTLVAATAAPTPAATAEPTATSTPTPTPTPELTPAPGDTFVGYDVAVEPGDYTIFLMSDFGDVTDSRQAVFDQRSHSLADRVVAPNGVLHWRVTESGYVGWSYVAGQSGDFVIREVFLGPDGTLRYQPIPDEQR